MKLKTPFRKSARIKVGGNPPHTKLQTPPHEPYGFYVGRGNKYRAALILFRFN
jgi:hypothetical protein